MPKCGECLWADVIIVALDANGKCPRCGADYGPPPQLPPVIDEVHAHADRAVLDALERAPGARRRPLV
jgi:hypothetical protein